MSDDFIELLGRKSEMDPDKHDGSYELVRETAKAIGRLEKEDINYKDMDLLYFMTVGTFNKVSSYKNKENRIEQSNIFQEDKNSLKNLLGKIRRKAKEGKYENSSGDDGSIGMFGSGFSSYVKFQADNKEYARFLKACSKIIEFEDEEEVLGIVEEVLKEKIKGLGIAGVSQILHCLKPNIFPILNRGEGTGIGAFRKLGIKLVSPEETDRYIENTRAIKEFRDKYFPFKNYRVIDLFFWEYQIRAEIEEPFLGIFGSKVNAEWAFDRILDVFYLLGVKGPEDLRVAISITHKGKALHVSYCNWLIMGFRGKGSEQEKIVLPLLREKGSRYKEFETDVFARRIGEPEVALYRLPLGEVKDFDEEFSSIFAETLRFIKEKFSTFSRSRYRSRDFHVQEIVMAVFDEEKREHILEKGLSEKVPEEPNIWLLKQTEKMESEKDEIDVYLSISEKTDEQFGESKSSSKIKEEDIILHLFEKNIQAISRVSSTLGKTGGFASKFEKGFKEWRIKIKDYFELDPVIPLENFKYGLKTSGFDISFLEQEDSNGRVFILPIEIEELKIIQGSQPATKWPEYEIFEELSFPGKKNPVYSIEDLSEETFLPKEELKRFLKALKRKGQGILYGPPGTGKTFVAEKVAQHLIGGSEGVYDIVQFHPAFAYEDFIQGIRPIVNSEGKLEYKLIPGRFMEFCEKSSESSGDCVLIIDEINRADLARVFGELMYLLEYRESEIPLASGKTLRVPPNLKIIGTMNTADRSIALVDYALRRRFTFFRLQPNYDVLEKFFKEKGINYFGLINVLKKLNNIISDPDYEIGHSFFLVDNLENQIQDIWQMEIIPYLDEYFFDQPEKVSDFYWNNIKGEIKQW